MEALRQRRAPDSADIQGDDSPISDPERKLLFSLAGRDPRRRAAFARSRSITG